MKRIGMGLIGPGFVAAHHIDAVRRLGYVDVVAIASSSLDSAKKKAAEYGVDRAYGSYEELIADPDVHVVHNTTPNYLHAAVIRATLARRKHIVSDKPLAMTAGEALELWKAAQAAGVVHAVTFNYRGNPLVQQARLMVARGEIGPVHYAHGAYLQEWLLEPTDYSWRLEPDKGGASSALGDIGSHWCDLVQHITGLRIEAVLADLTTVIKKRQRPARSAEAFARTVGATEEVDIKSEDLASVLVHFEGGAKGSTSIGQVCAGHKNGFWVEVSGAKASLRWHQEHQNELWIGQRHQPSAILEKHPPLLDPSVRKYTHLPGGHQEGWSDAFCNVLRDVYELIAANRGMAGPIPPPVATFEDGYRANRLVDAMLESHKQGGKWQKVRY